MTLTVFCILLFAALLHASWNAIVKASGDKMYAAIGVSGDRWEKVRRLDDGCVVR